MLQLLSNSAKALRGMSLILRVNILKNFGWSGRSNWFKQSEWDLAEISLASGFEGHNDFSKSFNFFLAFWPPYSSVPRTGLKRLRENMF